MRSGRPSAGVSKRAAPARRRERRWLFSGALWLCAACSGARLPACSEAKKLISDHSAASRAGQGAGPKTQKPQPWRPPKRETPAAWRALAGFLPDNIEGFRARMGRDGRDIDVGAAQPLLTVRRSYAGKDGVILDLELIDTSASPRLRELFGRTRELSRENDRAVFKAQKIQGQRAFTQWLDASKSARTSLLVGERYLLQVDTKPVTSPALGLGVAQKLDIPGLLALASTPQLPRSAPDAQSAARSGAPQPDAGLPPSAAEGSAQETPASEADTPGDDPGLDSSPL